MYGLPINSKKVYLDDATTTAFNFNSSTGTITGYSGSEKVVNIPSNIGGIYVKAIGENAFKNNTDIETVIIPEGVSSIEDFAFYKCTGLKYVSIPESVTSVSEDGFYRCGALNVTCKKGSTADNISLYPSGSTIVYYVEKGDINGDGSIDMRDVIILMKYVTGKVSEI
ncbi:MAG: leucine-rich repeat protein [Muribaculaceae bacterium]